MVDGAIVLVDAAEGPMPQTKFVVSQGAEDRPEADRRHQQDRPAGRARRSEVVNEVFDLFAALDATDEQLDFPILYGSGRNGWMAASPEGPKDQGLAPLFDLVLDARAAARTSRTGRSACSARILEANPFLGRIVTGRIASGTVKPEPDHQGARPRRPLVENGRVSKILAFRGLERQPIELGEAGDIVAIAGLEKGTVADTFCAPEIDTPIQAQPIDPPTVTMSFLVNDSAARRHRGRQGDEPRHPRPPVQARPRATSRSRSRNRPTRIRSTSPAAANCSSRS